MFVYLFVYLFIVVCLKMLLDLFSMRKKKDKRDSRYVRFSKVVGHVIIYRFFQLRCAYPDSGSRKEGIINFSYVGNNSGRNLGVLLLTFMLSRNIDHVTSFAQSAYYTFL